MFHNNEFSQRVDDAQRVARVANLSMNIMMGLRSSGPFTRIAFSLSANDDRPVLRYWPHAEHVGSNVYFIHGHELSNWVTA